MRHPFCLAVIVAGLTGCPGQTTGDFATSALFARLEARAAGEGQTEVRASLHSSAEAVLGLELGKDDGLTATFGETSKTLADLQEGGERVYGAVFDGEAADTALAVAFTRAKD